jgi:hypothetical protein
MKKPKPFTLIIWGMLTGGLTGLLLFYHLDGTKGWNPYGWWFMAAFLLAVLGGLAGLSLYSTFSSRSPKK